MGIDTFGNFINDTDKTLQELVNERTEEGEHAVALTSRYRDDDGRRIIELVLNGTLNDEQLKEIDPDEKVLCWDLIDDISAPAMTGVRKLKEIRPDLPQPQEADDPQNDNPLQAHLRKRE